MLSVDLPDQAGVHIHALHAKGGGGVVSFVSAIFILHSKRWGILPHMILGSPSIGKDSEI